MPLSPEGGFSHVSLSCGQPHPVSLPGSCGPLAVVFPAVPIWVCEGLGNVCMCVGAAGAFIPSPSCAASLLGSRRPHPSQGERPQRGSLSTHRRVPAELQEEGSRSSPPLPSLRHLATARHRDGEGIRLRDGAGIAVNQRLAFMAQSPVGRSSPDGRGGGSIAANPAWPLASGLWSVLPLALPALFLRSLGASSSGSMSSSQKTSQSIREKLSGGRCHDGFPLQSIFSMMGQVW